MRIKTKNNLKFKQPKKTNALKYDLLHNPSLLIMSIPGLIVILLFKYLPMWGILIAFKRYNIFGGFFASEWVGFKYFKQFFNDPYFFRLLKNTLVLSLYSLLWGFPAPIILALLLNEVKTMKFKKITQTITYLPYFISTVIIVGMLKNFLAGNGIINQMIMAFGHKPIIFFNEPGWFRTIYISSGIWQGIGWGSIIYLAAISGIDPQMYDAATIDGAGRFKRIIYITLPSIANTIIILLILRIGGLLSIGFEKVYLMYSPAIYETADVISTYVYRRGIVEHNFSFGTAVGLFNSIVSLILIVTANKISKKFSEQSLW